MADGEGGVGGDAKVIAALGLGWHMAEIHDVVPVPVGPERSPRDDRLVGFGDLSSYRRQLLGLDQIDFALATLEGAETWPDPTRVGHPDTGAARAVLAAIEAGKAGGPTGRTAYRKALQALHLDLLVVLQAANPGWGSAYRLGRGLADTVRAMDDKQLSEAFADGRIGHLVAATGDLATLLPPHAGKAVATSLGWWHKEVRRALDPLRATGVVKVTGDDPPRRRQALRDYQRDHRAATCAGWARRQPARVPAKADPTVELTDLEKALPRQGEVWRSVLSGEKAAVDMLQPEDYLQAATSFALRGAELARRSPPLALLAVGVVVVAAFLAVFLVGLAVSGSAAGRSAGALGGLVAALAAGWGVLKGRTFGALKKLEGPLWGAELDRAIANALTLPPVGGETGEPWTPLAISHAYDADVALSGADAGQAPAPQQTRPQRSRPSRPPRSRREPA